MPERPQTQQQPRRRIMAKRRRPKSKIEQRNRTGFDKEVSRPGYFMQTLRESNIEP